MRKKLILSFIITIFLLAFLGILSINKMVELSNLTKSLYNHPLSVTNSTKTIQFNIISIHRYMKDLIYADSEIERVMAIEQVNKSEKIVYKEFDNIFDRYLGDHNDIETSYKAFIDWKPIRDKTIQLVKDGKKTEAVYLRKTVGTPHLNMLNQQVFKLVDFAQRTAKYFLDNSIKTKEETVLLTKIVLITILFIVFFILLILLDNLNKSQENLKKQNNMLLHQSRLAQMGEMISMIAHQWRQPLGSISSTSIDLQMNIHLETFNLNDEQGRKECLEYFTDGLLTIDKLVKNLTTTIDDFRNFYKSNKTTKFVTINTPISKALDVIRKSLEADNISVIENYNSTKQVELYFNEFMQVVLNIFKNAQDNFKERNIKNAKLVITSHDTKQGISITIQDNGGGIPKEVLPKIFDPYFSTKDEKNGTGLGLYMSKIIIQDHHYGKLSVYCDNKNTNFNILINEKIKIS